ncbi:hypothetical protein [Streptomyces sp. NPDC001292]|uniref:hypothetical protein n=1 Tax=Streptomyces sp. NPDC001292 TaxID=3364558 RepID=UPI00367D7F29
MRRRPGGGHEEARTLLPREEAYRILAHDEPRPRAAGTEARALAGRVEDVAMGRS